jgi:hypothetical protein
MSRKQKAPPSSDRNQFGAEWAVRLTQKGIGAPRVVFIHAFDFTDYLHDEGDVVQQCVDFLRAGAVGRILFHVARYFHSVFVLSSEDLPDLLRSVALWYIMHQRAALTRRSLSPFLRPFQSIDDLLPPRHVLTPSLSNPEMRCSLGCELLGDPEKDELSAGTYRPGRDRMVPRLLELEIDRMHEIVAPRPEKACAITAIDF